VAPVEMNAGICWGKNTIDPSGRGIEKHHKATLTFLTFQYIMVENKYILKKCLYFCLQQNQTKDMLLHTIMNK
jgi:hypothetical protein